MGFIISTCQSVKNYMEQSTIPSQVRAKVAQVQNEAQRNFFSPLSSVIVGRSAQWLSANRKSCHLCLVITSLRMDLIDQLLTECPEKLEIGVQLNRYVGKNCLPGKGMNMYSSVVQISEERRGLGG